MAASIKVVGAGRAVITSLPSPSPSPSRSLSGAAAPSNSLAADNVFSSRCCCSSSSLDSVRYGHPSPSFSPSSAPSCCSNSSSNFSSVQFCAPSTSFWSNYSCPRSWDRVPRRSVQLQLCGLDRGSRSGDSDGVFAAYGTWRNPVIVAEGASSHSFSSPPFSGISNTSSSRQSGFFCKLKWDGFRGEPGRFFNSRGTKCYTSREQRARRRGIIWNHGELKRPAAAAGVGGMGLLLSGLDSHGRLVVDDIKSILSKDKQWMEDSVVSLFGGQSNVEESGRSNGGPEQGRGGGRAEHSRNRDNNWARGLLLAAIPGIAGFNLSGPQSVLEALGVLATIITVHEAGHLVAARLQNIHVTKFAVGFGPTLAKYRQRGVEYSLRAFPLGGFVAFPDDDPDSEIPPDDPDLLKNRPILDRALVISAGVIANIIFAYSVLFVQTVGIGLVERELLPGVIVPEVLGKSAASKGGMHVGDVILAVDDYKLAAEETAVVQLVDTIKKSAGRPITFFVLRSGNIVGVEVTPDENRDGSGRIGVQLSPNIRPHRVKAENLPDAVLKSGREFARLTSTVYDGLKQIFFNFEKTVDNVSGPVAIVAVGAEVARADVAGLYQFAAIVNINLAIVNLLPLPALDGGYLAFVLLEALRGGKKIPAGVERGIMSSGVLLLLVMGIALMVRDTINLGQQML